MLKDTVVLTHDKMKALTEFVLDLKRRGCYTPTQIRAEARAEFGLTHSQANYQVNKILKQRRESDG